MLVNCLAKVIVFIKPLIPHILFVPLRLSLIHILQRKNGIPNAFNTILEKYRGKNLYWRYCSSRHKETRISWLRYSYENVGACSIYKFQVTWQKNCKACLLYTSHHQPVLHPGEEFTLTEHFLPAHSHRECFLYHGSMRSTMVEQLVTPSAVSAAMAAWMIALSRDTQVILFPFTESDIIFNY